MAYREKDLINITVPELPKSIYLCYEIHLTDKEREDQALEENLSGAELVEKMIHKYLGEDQIRVVTEKYEKPKAYAGGIEISVSFSHTDNAVASAVSRHLILGCDMESADRKVHPCLVERIKHHDESDEIYQRLKPVQIWTFKEAALKMIGTGLRRPMNSVNVSLISEKLFNVDLGHGNRAKICSFQYKGHWISVCYQ